MGDTGSVGGCCEISRMVGETEYFDAETIFRQNFGLPSCADVLAGPDMGDPCVVEIIKRIDQRVVAKVERVVVRKRYAIHSEVDEQIDRCRRCPEEERLARRQPRLTLSRDTAFEI
jgi:hypothetical protein